MNYNLSEWALKNKGLVLYLMLLLGIVGVVSYSKLAQSEDPPFTFKVMVVQTYWPGATAREVSEQVTDRIEKELMTTGKYERIMAYSRPGESMVTFVARDAMRSSEIPDVWYDVRKKVGDIKHQLPNGVQGPFFNDEFGDTFGNIYVLTGKDFDYAQAVKKGSRLRVATKYVDIAREFFAKKGVHVDLIKLYGSMELAPLTGLADAIVDLVSTGNTLKANDLIEVEPIMEISSRLIVNRAAMKLKHEKIQPLIDAFNTSVSQSASNT